MKESQEKNSSNHKVHHDEGKGKEKEGKGKRSVK